MLTALIYTAGAIAFAAILAATALACVILSGRLSRREAEDQALALTRPPAAARNAPAPAPVRPGVPPPGLFPPAHNRGRIACTSRRYQCGCTHYYTPLGVLFHVVPCRPGVGTDWDAEFRRIAP